jgi:hypothetical protein
MNEHHADAGNLTIGLALFGLFVVLFALTFVVALVYLAVF